MTSLTDEEGAGEKTLSDELQRLHIDENIPQLVVRVSQVKPRQVVANCTPHI